VFGNDQYVSATLNFQHNCQDGNCKISINHMRTNDKKEGVGETYLVEHSSYNSYILNVASLRHPELYRRISNLEFPIITQEMWEDNIEKGVDEWKEQVPQNTKKSKAKKSDEKTSDMTSEKDKVANPPKPTKTQEETPQLNMIEDQNHLPYEHDFPMGNMEENVIYPQGFHIPLNNQKTSLSSHNIPMWPAQPVTSVPPP
jgi:hypothetical protein